MEDANIGHIEPKTMRKDTFDEIASKEFRDDVRQRQAQERKPVLQQELNIQPMHKSCNLKMGSAYPPVPIITHCSCCEYMYIAKRNKKGALMDAIQEQIRLENHVESSPDFRRIYVDGVPAGIELPSNAEIGDRFRLLTSALIKTGNPDWVLYPQEWRPVLPRDDDDTWQWKAEEIALLRRTKLESGTLVVSWRFTYRTAFHYGDGLVSPSLFVMFGSRKDGRRQAGLVDDVRIGNLISLSHMLQHNLSRFNNFQELWGVEDKDLSAEESRIVSLLPWGSGWSDADWCRKEFDDFGVVAVDPKGMFAQRSPQTANKVFVYINPKGSKIVSVPY